MRNHTFILVLLVLLISGLVLVACGGAGQQAEPTQPPIEEEATEVPAEPTATEEVVEEATPTEEAAAEEATPTEEAAADATPTVDLVERPEGGLLIWADETRAPIMQEFGDRFSEEYGVPIAVQQLGFGDIRDQLKIAGPAGEGPDILIGAHDWLGELVINGLLNPVDLGDKEDQFVENAVQAFTYEGELYGMPYATENVAFFRNPDLVPDAPQTWSEVTEMTAQLEEAGEVEQGYVLQQADPYHFYPIMTAFGGYVFGVTEDGTYDPDDVGIDSDGSLAAAQWLGMMVEEGHLRPDVDYEVMHTMFENGDAAMMISGPWALPRIQESGIPYEVSPIPSEEEPGQPFLGVQGFMVSAFSEDPLLAQTFLTEFIATEEAMQAIYDADPRPSAFLPVREGISDEDIAAFASAGETGNPMPAIPEMSSVWTAWGDAITLIMQGEEPAASFENAAEQIRTAIQAE